VENGDVLMPEKDNRQRAERVKMIIMDVDGTLTDGTLLLLPDGEEVKSYNVLDGLGMLLANLAGIKTGIITGKISKPLAKRAKNLNVSELHQGILDKKRVLFEILKKHHLHQEEVAYIGDDLGDLDVIKEVGFAGAVANAHAIIKEHSHYHCRLEGGKGAVREFIEFILTVQNKWDTIQDKITNIKGNPDIEQEIIRQ
jgi:3-deoxy-D-manno-octulosonate 8-phosphate phosphatase (KDO 8-P phosphatase)